MDVKTKKGQQACRDEEVMVEIWQQANPGWRYVHTNKDDPSKLDAVLVNNGVVQALAEQKSRYKCSLDFFRKQWQNEWLITFEKIDKLRNCCAMFGVPLVGFLYLVESRDLLTIRLLDSNGDFLQPMRIEYSDTAKTTNDKNRVTRYNAYVNMQDARHFSA